MRSPSLFSKEGVAGVSHGMPCACGTAAQCSGLCVLQGLGEIYGGHQGAIAANPSQSLLRQAQDRLFCKGRSAPLATRDSSVITNFTKHQSFDSSHPLPRIAKHAHPWAECRAACAIRCGPIARTPGQIDVERDPLRVRHHDRKAAIGCGEGRHAER